MADPEWVQMRHPSHGQNGATATATRAAFDEVWADKGWQLVGTAAGPEPVGEERTVETNG